MEEERREYIKKQRKALKENPKGFIIENIINPTLEYWKKRPINAIGVFLFWIVTYYLVFGGIQAIVFDSVYCDASINQFDGKIMYVHNDFVKYYNEEAKRMQYEYKPIGYVDENNKVNEFNRKYTMKCEHDWKRWNNETIEERLQSIFYGFKKIILKE